MNGCACLGKKERKNCKEREREGVKESCSEAVEEG